MFKFLNKKLRSEKGEAYVGEGVKIVICIVLGAALLAGLVLVANKVILPKTEKYIIALFNKGDDMTVEVALDSMGITEGDKRALRWQTAMAILMQTEEYRHAETVCQGSDARYLVDLATSSESTDITREEADAMFEEAKESGDEYRIQLANSYFALRDRYDSEEIQTKVNGFTKDYMKLAVECNRGNFSNEEIDNKLRALGDKWDVDVSNIG